MNYVPTAQWEIQSHIWRKTSKKLLFFLILPSFITQFCLLWLVFNLLYIEGNKKNFFGFEISREKNRLQQIYAELCVGLFGQLRKI